MRVPFKARVLTERLLGRSVFEASYYRESQYTRLMNLFAHVDLDHWKGKRVLEVGAGLGQLGEAFRQVGFDVRSTDGRPEHVKAMKARGLDAAVLDLNAATADDFRGFDIVLAFGVLYHLDQPDRFLHACGEASSILLLESAVCDEVGPVVKWVEEAQGRRGTDQALRGRGCRPSPSWVEQTCASAGFATIRDISSALGNWEIGSFNWTPTGDGESRRDGVNFRKMWVCEP
jgi:SAM-dependent methyltransferase